MALATLKSNPQTASTSHRRYRDPAGTQTVACVDVSAVQLAALAATADQIELRQPLGGGWVPDDFVDRIANGLRALPLLTGSKIANGDVARRRVRQLICDGLARMRVRYGRHILAGEFQRLIDGKPARVLVLVLAQRQVISCDWHIT